MSAAQLAKKSPAKKAKWSVYLLECADGTLYCGVTTDLARRVREHNGKEKGRANAGAKYTHARRPVRLAHVEKAATRSAALKREAAIKKLPRTAKLSLAKGSSAR